MSGGEARAGAGIRTGEIVLPARKLDETLAFFTERLGFRVAAVFPADSPSVVVVSGHGLRIRLEREGKGAPGVLRLLCDDPSALAEGLLELVAPNGTRVELAAWNAPLQLPALRPSFVLTRIGEASGWAAGRAGMLYRDLIPDRQGGRFIASHIRIPAGGAVPDYVHRHRVRFQLIYCYRGCVRVVYEDQGPAVRLEAGDAVLQPPEIRHRVLESSAGLEVIEVSCPAEHETLADLELALPTPVARPERDFGGQRFVRHQAARADWAPWRVPGFEARDLGHRSGHARSGRRPGREVARPGVRPIRGGSSARDARRRAALHVRPGRSAQRSTLPAGRSGCRRAIPSSYPRAARTRSESARPTWSCWKWRSPPDSRP